MHGKEFLREFVFIYVGTIFAWLRNFMIDIVKSFYPFFLEIVKKNTYIISTNKQRTNRDNLNEGK